MCRTKIRFARPIGMGISFVAVALCLTEISWAQHRAIVSPPCPQDSCEPGDFCAFPPGALFCAGLEKENLQIVVTGPNFNVLEVYFKASETDQNVKRDVISDAANLHANRSLVLGPPSPAGTFAVRYGSTQDKFKIYSWTQQAGDLNAFGPCCLEPGYPVCLHFLTNRLLKVTYGQDGAKTKIYRCISNSNTWTDAEKTLSPSVKPCP